MITTEKRHLYTLIVVIFALFGYREWITQSTPINLFFDEAYYYGWSQSLDWGYYSKPPMVAWIIRLTTDLLGASEWAIKIGAPLLYSLTSIILFFIGRRIQSSKCGLFAALLFISMPLVSFNSLFMTTDAPLIFFWALGLWLFLIAKESNGTYWWVLAGIAGGFGLLSKYTYILFPVGFLLYAISSEDGRKLLANGKFWLACSIAILFLAPNLWWNYQHDFISFQHTAEISQQAQGTYSIARLGEFLLTQIITFGPISIAALVFTLASKKDNNSKLLWSLLVPIFIVISIQALSAKANINWAAPAFVTGSLLAAIYLARLKTRWLIFSLAVNMILMTGFYHLESIHRLANIQTTSDNSPFWRIRGWPALADQINPKIADFDELNIASESRKVAAYMSYYLKPMRLEPRALNLDGIIKNQYELKQPLAPGNTEKFIFISENLSSVELSKYFEYVSPITTEEVKAAIDWDVKLHVTIVSGLKAK